MKEFQTNRDMIIPKDAWNHQIQIVEAHRKLLQAQTDLVTQLMSLNEEWYTQSINQNNMKAKAELFAPKLMKLEGGFVNHPNDPGGATMKGVTLNTYKDFCKKAGRPEPTIEDLKNISDTDWAAIFKRGYWDKIKADEINNQSIAEILVDWIYNSGPGMVKNIQTIIGVTADGIAGPKTVAAINDAEQEKLFNNIKDARIKFYNDIIFKNSKLETFRKGWMNRINEFTFKA